MMDSREMATGRTNLRFTCLPACVSLKSCRLVPTMKSACGSIRVKVAGYWVAGTVNFLFPSCGATMEVYWYTSLARVRGALLDGGLTMMVMLEKSALNRAIS